MAVAQSSDPGKLTTAAEEFDEGTKSFKRKDFEEAAAHFEAADRYAPSPAAVANAIRARKSAKQLARAATLAAQGLAKYPDDKALADVAKDALKGVDKLHKVDVSCSPGCTLVVDGKVASAEAVPSYTMYLDPGAHTVVAGWSGDRSKSSSINATKGGSDTLNLAAPEEVKPPPVESATAPAATSSAPPLPPPKEDHKPLPPWTVIAGAGVTVALAGVATWSGIDAQKHPGPDAVKAGCVGQGTSCSLYQDGLSKEHRTNALWIGTGAVAVLTGVAAAFFVDWNGEPSSPAQGSLRIRPLAGASPSGASVGVGGDF